MYLSGFFFQSLFYFFYCCENPFMAMIFTACNFPRSNFTVCSFSHCCLYARQLISTSNVHFNWIKNQLFILVFRLIHEKIVGRSQITQDSSVVQACLTALFIQFLQNFWSRHVFGEAKIKGQGQNILRNYCYSFRCSNGIVIMFFRKGFLFLLEILNC